MFEGSFGEFVRYAVRRSRYDRFAAVHFRHSGNGGYLFEGDMEIFEERLRAYEQGKTNELVDWLEQPEI